MLLRIYYCYYTFLYIMSLQFNTNPSFLSSRLFSPDRPRIGATTYLNVNVLPDFVEYIKRNLKPQELIALSEYQLQTYILELCIKEKVTDSLDSLVQKILAYVRSRKQFWNNGIIVGSKENQEKQKQEQKHQHQAIIQYEKDTQIIQSKVPNYPQKVFDNKKKRRIYPFMTTLKTDFIDKSKEVMKFNVTNYSMMPAYVLRDFLKDEMEIKRLSKYENLEKAQKDLLSILQNATEYFLMQQKPKNIKNQPIKRRQIVRQRRIPAHLIENLIEPVLQDQKIDDQAELYSKQSHDMVEPLNFHQNTQKNVPIKCNNPQGKEDKKIEEQYLQNSDQSSQEQENKFYLDFHKQVSKKQFYDSKMFSKQSTINQSHNIIEILKCLVYLQSNKQDRWFDKKWKEIQQERIMKLQKEQQEQNDQKHEKIQQHIEEENQIKKKVENQNLNQNYENKMLSKIGQNKDEIVDKQNQHCEMQKLQNQDQKQKESEKIIEQSQESQMIQKQNQIQQQVIQIGIKKPIFDHIWKHPQTWSYKRLSKHLSQRFLTMREIYFVTKEFINRQILYEFNEQKSIFKQKQNSYQLLQESLVDPQGTNLDEILLQFKEMIEHPENVKLSAFKTQGIKIPWDQSDYFMFLKGLRQYYFIPTNNRKIALFMMSKSTKKNIEANHVKYVKAIYLRNMQVRIDRGESGGGKKSKMQGKIEFIDKDIENFSMRWFDKMKKSKKKLRRRRFDDDDIGEEGDSAY